MDHGNILASFFAKAATDARVGIAHIGLFVTLLQMISEQDGPALEFYSKEVMFRAKISSSATFHKLIRQLNEYGYVQYKPSYYKGKGSNVYINN